MALNSSWVNKETAVILGIGVCPLRGESKGPAPKCTDQEDIIDEAIKLFRFNMSMKSFPVKGPADRTLVYLTVYLNWFITKLVDINNKKDAQAFSTEMAIKMEIKPAEKNHFMNGLMLPAVKKDEPKTFVDYQKQLRQEIGDRIVERLYVTNGEKSVDFKFWAGVSRRPFMSMRYDIHI